MTKKDFVAIAEAIGRLPETTSKEQVMRAMADVCAASSPRFQHLRFMRACGFTPALPAKTE